MRIVILGSGYVASAYMRTFLFLGFHPVILSRAWLDYTDLDQLSRYLELLDAELVVNCAGFTGKTVDDCAKDIHQCIAANMVLPGMVAEVCASAGVPLIHISSGCIFTGPGVWKEDDEPNNMDQPYARSKVFAEQRITTSGALAWIFRIRMPFNHLPHQRNWLTKLANYPLILDGLNSITLLDEFTMRSYLVFQKAEPGIYHAAYPTPVRTIEVARMLRDVGIRKLPVHEWIPSDFRKSYGPRSEAVLDSSKFESACGAAFGDPLVAIRWCMEQMNGRTVLGSADPMSADTQDKSSPCQ
jgi:dTDP-4-dehydrorhamnose reductase